MGTNAREPVWFPSQPNLNPVGQTHQVEASSSENKSHEQVQVVTILMGGKIIEKSKDPKMSHPTVQEEEIANHSDSTIKTTLE